jgi:hypothetical protein
MFRSINIYFFLKRVVMDTIVRLREQGECISTPTFYNVDSVRTLRQQLEPLEVCGMSFHCTLIQIHSNTHTYKEN